MAGIITAIAFIAYAALLLATSWPIEDWSINKASLFGDSFGVLNSFFTAGAFLLILWTIVLQQAELKLQRQEMSRMSAAHQRELHMNLMNYAFEDESLAKVWGSDADDRTEFRQMMYVGIIIGSWHMGYQQGIMNKKITRYNLESTMKDSSYFRHFWKKVGKDWQRTASLDKEFQDFYEMANSAYQKAMDGLDEKSNLAKE